jgi:hypothetical protein
MFRTALRRFTIARALAIGLLELQVNQPGLPGGKRYRILRGGANPSGRN